MSILRKTSLLLMLSIAIFACSDDEEDDNTTSGNNNNNNNPGEINDSVQQADLVGTWKAYEFKGSDDQYYGLSEYFPEYYEDDNGCTVEDVEYWISSYTLNITAGNEYKEDLDSKERFRDVNTYDSTNCNITYGNWQESNNDSDNNYTYSILSSRAIEISQRDTSGNVIYADTVEYALRGDVLEIYEGQTRLRK